MNRQDIENNVGYHQEKANLEYIRKRYREEEQDDAYLITEVEDAFDAGFDKGYQYAVEKVEKVLSEKIGVSGDIILLLRRIMED